MPTGASHDSPRPSSPTRLVPVTSGSELLDLATMQATIEMLSPAYSAGVKAGLNGKPCRVSDSVLSDLTGRHLEEFNAGHLRGRQIAAQTDDGSPSMLPENIDPGAGVVEKCHGNPVENPLPTICANPAEARAMARKLERFNRLSSSVAGATDAPPATNAPGAAVTTQPGASAAASRVFPSPPKEWIFTRECKTNPETLARSLEQMLPGQWGWLDATWQTLSVIGRWWPTGAIDVFTHPGQKLRIVKCDDKAAMVCCTGSCAHYGHAAENVGDGLYICHSCSKTWTRGGDEYIEPKHRLDE